MVFYDFMTKTITSYLKWEICCVGLMIHMLCNYPTPNSHCLEFFKDSFLKQSWNTFELIHTSSYCWWLLDTYNQKCISEEKSVICYRKVLRLQKNVIPLWTIAGRLSELIRFWSIKAVKSPWHSFLERNDVMLTRVDFTICREIINFQPLPIKVNMNERTEETLVLQPEDEKLIARVLNLWYWLLPLCQTILDRAFSADRK